MSDVFRCSSCGSLLIRKRREGDGLVVTGGGARNFYHDGKFEVWCERCRETRDAQSFTMQVSFGTSFALAWFERPEAAEFRQQFVLQWFHSPGAAGFLQTPEGKAFAARVYDISGQKGEGK